MSEIKDAKKVAELSKKLAAEKSTLETRKDMLEQRIREGKDATTKAIDVKYSADRVASLQKEIDKLT